MNTDALKSFLPDHPVATRIWRGPFRGARIVMNPRNSMRKIFGLYEHELNTWLEQALLRVNRVLDVGANDGYFTFGCAAAFRRMGKTGEIIGFEPQERHVNTLLESVAAQGRNDISFKIVHALVGQEVGDGVTTLDAHPTAERTHTLVKIDVEGAEVDVIEGAQLWMHPSNLFVIEVHKEPFLSRLQRTFASHGLHLLQINQRPLPLLGRETRDEQNWWLVSSLDTGN